MKVINVGSRTGPSQLTVLATGSSRAGKTHFLGTWPRPLVLADASEHGYTTYDFMDEDYLYEPGQRPYVIAIEHPRELLQCLIACRNQAAGKKVDLPGWPVPQGKWEIGTVGIDSLTYYADAYMNKLEVEAATTDGKPADKRQLYGDLAAHLRHVMIQFHELPYHIVWTALAAVNEDSALRGALIAGQTSAKAPARTDLWLYLETAEVKTKGKRALRYDAHTQNFRGFKAGHRFGRFLPEVIDPEYRVIEEALNIEPWINRVQKGNTKGRAKGAANTSNRAAAQ